ncbi:MAG: hypothetical protein HOU81_16515, partial [Hamadaea sp.]|nr:hypothetical protein [Hamadaea sp.]
MQSVEGAAGAVVGAVVFGALLAGVVGLGAVVPGFEPAGLPGAVLAGWPGTLG